MTQLACPVYYFNPSRPWHRPRRSLPVLAIWIVLGILYLLYLNRTNPKGLERGKDVFLEDLEPEPKNLLSALE